MRTLPVMRAGRNVSNLHNAQCARRTKSDYEFSLRIYLPGHRQGYEY